MRSSSPLYPTPSSRLRLLGWLGKAQQLVGAVERDGDVEHNGRTCGRTGTYALVDYLRSDKATPLAGDSSFPSPSRSFSLAEANASTENGSAREKASLRLGSIEGKGGKRFVKSHPATASRGEMRLANS